MVIAHYFKRNSFCNWIWILVLIRIWFSRGSSSPIYSVTRKRILIQFQKLLRVYFPYRTWDTFHKTLPIKCKYYKQWIFNLVNKSEIDRNVVKINEFRIKCAWIVTQTVRTKPNQFLYLPVSHSIKKTEWDRHYKAIIFCLKPLLH